MSLVANGAFLACSLMLLVLARAGAIAPPSPSSPSHVLASATTSPTATVSPTPDSGWLQVAPTSVELQCGNGQQTQFVVLRNTGSDDVQWQIRFASGNDQVGISVSQTGGDLRAGTSTALQLQIRRHAGNQQGVVTFDPGTPDAGAPASLSYTIAGCD